MPRARAGSVWGALALTAFPQLVPIRSARAADRVISRRAESDDPWWGTDKALHFSTAAVLAAGGYAGAAAAGQPRWVRWLAGAGTAVGLGALKEAWDATGHGDPSWRDFTWDVVGAATGLVTAWAVDQLWAARRSRLTMRTSWARSVGPISPVSTSTSP